MAVCQPIAELYWNWPEYEPAVLTFWDSAHKKDVDCCASKVKPPRAVAVAPVSFFTQPSSKLFDATLIGAVVTLAEVDPAPGSVIAEKIGGTVTSEPDTANTWNTKGAAFVKLTVTVCVALVL